MEGGEKKKTNEEGECGVSTSNHVKKTGRDKADEGTECDETAEPK